MTKCKPVLLSVALSLLLVGCGGTDVPQQQQPVVQQPVVQQPVAQQPVVQQPVVQQPDPVAAAKRIAQKFPVGVHFQPAYHVEIEDTLVRDYWSKVVYVVEEPARFDVRKTDSLVSPFEATIEVTYRDGRVIGGDLSQKDLYGPNAAGESDDSFSTKEKAEAAMEMRLALSDCTHRFRFSWQDGKWNMHDEQEFRFGRTGWGKGPTAKRALSDMKRWGVYQP
jgi:hypothetical protein